MKKVLAITCHQVTNPLIHTVNYFSSFDDNTILIHVDKKSAIHDFEFLKKENVILIEDRVDVKWGGVSQIEATLNLMKFSRKYQYDYFFLLSGDDIPIQTNSQFNEFLTKNAGYNLIHYQDERGAYIDPHQRVKYKYTDVFFSRSRDIKSRALRVLHRLTREYLFKNKSYFSNLYKTPTMYKGTNWFGLTEYTTGYILDFISSHDWYFSMFEKSICADEIFFHTIIKSSDDNLIYNNKELRSNAMRYIDWISGPEYPRVLTNEDFDKIINSNMLLARKIHKDASKEFMMSFINK
ncbi:beta-1,6-N-acetylglucosaminyltransferase [Pseudomonas protegens]|uniref:beta-1,6-N-acetylglucosaminyltransferase n=1 Tax=Pseudomonas protegens TaxID=380021 RepID=UPI0021C609E5|nr:beta-1,6-N-acetylglucosaminyltransferase [Pseudomonas protegens]MCU1767344.1 beta-1,6-N-acetylglucosaminyltransferase [Pseudomonas protegens]